MEEGLGVSSLHWTWVWANREEGLGVSSLLGSNIVLWMAGSIMEIGNGIDGREEPYARGEPYVGGEPYARWAWEIGRASGRGRGL